MSLDINARLLEIVHLPKITEAKSNPRACWLDGDECPYGQPGGKFTDRPRKFCRLSVCHKLTDSASEIEELTEGEYFETAVEEAVSQKFSNKSKPLSELLGEIANDDFNGNEEEEKQTQSVLLLAAEILMLENSHKGSNLKVLDEASL